MDKIKISVIIAIYNIEGYIKKCIDSVLNIPIDNLEIIAIDDGSTDACGKICDEYAKAHENVFVFHKPNGGLSDARNFGLDKAQGDYVLFLDGDDLLLPEFAELCRTAERTSADIVIGKAQLSHPSSAMERFEKIADERFAFGTPVTGCKYLTGCLSGGALRVEAWRHLFRRDFLSENRLSFKVGTTHEDEEFTPRALLAANRVVPTNAVFYCYNNAREGSIMNTQTPRKAHDKATIYSEQLKLFKAVKPRRLKRLLEDDISWKYMDIFKTNGLDLKAKRFLPITLAYHPKRRIKAAIFAVSPKLYTKHF